MVIALLEERDLCQNDLVDVFKTESIASAVLNGRRDLTVEQNDKLARRFNLPHEWFFPKRLAKGGSEGAGNLVKGSARFSR